MNQESLGMLWRWVDPGLARAADRGVVVSALVAGVLADLAVRSGGALSAAILVFVVGAAFLVPAPHQASVVENICSRPPRTTKGWAAWNAAHRAADDARRNVCSAQ